MAQNEQTAERVPLLAVPAGMELLEDGSFGEATVPLQEAARQAPEKSSVREALGRAYFRTRQLRRGGDRVRGGGRDATRSTTTPTSASAARSSLTGERERRPPSPGAGLEPAPRAARLPDLPRPPARGVLSALCGRSSSGSARRRWRRRRARRRDRRRAAGPARRLARATPRRGRPARRQGPRRCGSSTTPTGG